MDASTAKGCMYCGSKKHGTITCMLHKPKGFWLKEHKPTPTIPVSEVSRLISLARKNCIIKHVWSDEDVEVMNNCFAEIRRVLELRRRGRK